MNTSELDLSIYICIEQLLTILCFKTVLAVPCLRLGLLKIDARVGIYVKKFGLLHYSSEAGYAMRHHNIVHETRALYTINFVI